MAKKLRSAGQDSKFTVTFPVPDWFDDAAKAGPRTWIEHAILKLLLFGDKEGARALSFALCRPDEKFSEGDRKLLANLIADLIEGKLKRRRGPPPLAHLLVYKDLHVRAAADQVDEAVSNGIPVKDAMSAAAAEYHPPNEDQSDFENRIANYRSRGRQARDRLL